MFNFFTCIAFALFFSSTSLAVDCRNAQNEVEKLTCATKPILLKAMTPSLDIPKCGSDNNSFKVPSEIQATAGIFVSCLQDNLVSCMNIAKALAKDGGGAKVNVVIKNSDIGILENQLGSLLSGLGGKNINIIPISSASLPYYMRDFGVMRSSGKSNQLVANPYLLPGSSQADGHEIAQEIAKKCSMGFDTSYMHIPDLKYRKFSAQNDPEVELKKVFPDLKDGKWKDGIKERMQTDSGSERWAMGQRWPNENYQGPIMGGNFMGLPGGVLAIGESNARSADPDVLKYFEKNQPVAKITIPALGIGHIDEIFKVVPSKGKCGYALVRASPQTAKSFLRSRPANEKFGDISGLKDSVLNMMDLKTEQYRLHEELIQNPSSQAEEKFLKSTRRNLETGEILKDKELMDYWDKLQLDINTGTEQLISEVNKAKGTSCQPDIIDVPTFFTVDGVPAVANPVNGLYINGRYFKSQSSKTITTKNRQDKLEKKPYPELDQFINEKLKGIAVGGIIQVDTGDYDIGNGNLHCATMNIFAPCL